MRVGGFLCLNPSTRDKEVGPFAITLLFTQHLSEHASSRFTTPSPSPQLQMSNAEDTPYHAKAPVKEGLQAGAIGAGVGLLVSAVQNSVGTHSHGATGVFARTGSTIGVFAAMAGVFAATDAAVSNVRETKDAWNSVAAGCASGLVAGGFQRNAQTMVFGCLGMGAMMGAFDLSGNSLKGKYADMTEQQKQEWRELQLKSK
ncbi:unnamed protein product [Mortierella alpina]